MIRTVLTTSLRTKLPTATDLISSALVPRRARSFQLPFSRAFRSDFQILPAPFPVSNPSGASQLALAMYPYQAPLQDGTNQRQRTFGSAKYEPQRFPAPHPNMYPIPPPMNPFPTQPLPLQAYQQHPLPPGARMISPPRFPTADDLKYKCGVCGRFRSPRYHYKHPIPPGELPKSTVCRRCREEATDTEDEDSDSYEERTPRSRSRRSVRRARSLSRGYDMLPRRQARSSSRNARRVRIVEEERPPRARSPGVELVRYVEPRQQRPVTRTIYVEDDRRHRTSGSSYEDDLYIVSDEEYDCPPR